MRGHEIKRELLRVSHDSLRLLLEGDIEQGGRGGAGAGGGRFHLVKSCQTCWEGATRAAEEHDNTITRHNCATRRAPNTNCA